MNPKMFAALHAKNASGNQVASASPVPPEPEPETPTEDVMGDEPDHHERAMHHLTKAHGYAGKKKGALAVHLRMAKHHLGKLSGQ